MASPQIKVTVPSSKSSTVTATSSELFWEVCGSGKVTNTCEPASCVSSNVITCSAGAAGSGAWITCTMREAAAWVSVPVTFGCSDSKWPSSWAWEVKSSPQSSQGKVLSDCLKCSVVTWCCSAPGKRKVAAQYKHRNGCDPEGGRRHHLAVEEWWPRATRGEAEAGTVRMRKQRQGA